MRPTIRATGLIDCGPVKRRRFSQIAWVDEPICFDKPTLKHPICRKESYWLASLHGYRVVAGPTRSPCRLRDFIDNLML